MINDKKTFTLTVLFLVTIVFSWKFYFQEYNQSDTIDVHQFPTTINGWTATEIPITEKDYAILETRNTFVRQYTSPQGEEVILYIVYSQNNRKAVHPPEICYTGGGGSIVDQKHELLETPDKKLRFNVNKVYFEHGPIKQVVMYWFKAGPYFTGNYLKQQMNVSMNYLFGRKTGGALIRLSAVVRNNDMVTTEKTLHKFALTILPALKKYIQ